MISTDSFCSSFLASLFFRALEDILDRPVQPVAGPPHVVFGIGLDQGKAPIFLFLTQLSALGLQFNKDQPTRSGVDDGEIWKPWLGSSRIMGVVVEVSFPLAQFDDAVLELGFSHP